MADCAGLPGESSSLNRDNSIELPYCIGQNQRLHADNFKGLKPKLIINGSIIYRQIAISINMSYPGNRLLPSACAVILYFSHL